VTEVFFPRTDEGTPDTEGVVATWFVDDGATVAAGQLLAEVQVTKVSDEVKAPEAGVLHHEVDEGAVVAQGARIGSIE
jgi:pyruvate/2-oxoglutarate dehydrogenase complex dihydrolipoamide acyltransferase (E2) component